MYKSATYSN